MKVRHQGYRSSALSVGGLLLAALWAALATLALRPLLSHAHSVIEDRELQVDCGAWLAQADMARALQLVSAQLSAQGMKLVPQACPFVRVAVGQMQQVLDVRVEVINSDVASQFVRGPLSDGQEVDMGGVHLAAPALAQGWAASQTPQEEVSPDISFNRQWLAELMQSRGLEPVAGHWWAFVPMTVKK